MVTTLEFLKHVLPESGYYHAWNKRTKGGTWHDTIEGLAADIQTIDSTGNDAFFACSTFMEPTSRTQSNVQYTKALWLDLDVGENKPYADPKEAVGALAAFLSKAGLPRPTALSSGYGVHVWWSLEASAEVSDWLVSSRALKQACIAHGLHADPARTADSASILRAPGTFNYKNPNDPRPVKCGTLQPPVDLAEFTRLLEASMPKQEKPSGLNDALTNVYTGPHVASSAALAADKCAQLRQMRDTGGNIPEPLWYAGLCVLAHCEDGEQLYQDWSSGHMTYSARETEQKFIHAQKSPGPTTCAAFKGLNPSGCDGCPFAVTSPIVLGREAVDTAPPEAQEVSKPKLPKGYFWGNAMQLMTQLETGDGTTQPVIISRYPVYMTGLFSSEKSDRYKIAFQHWLPVRGWKEVTLDAEEFYGRGALGALQRVGINIHGTALKLFMEYVHRANDWLRETKEDGKMYDQFGWKNDDTEFLYGEYLYHADGTATLADLSPNLKVRAALMKLPPKGSLEGWKAAAKKLMALGWEAQGSTLLASFAAPLMKFATAMDEGGSIFGLYSQRGGTGKTTALAAATSVWGSIKCNQMVKRDTDSSKFALLTEMGNLPAFEDEMGDQDPDAAKRFCESVTVGRAASRLRKTDGDYENNMARLGWCTILMTAGNYPLTEVLERSGNKAQQTRILELEATLPKGYVAKDETDLVDNLMANRGYAGDLYISFITRPKNLAGIKARIARKVPEYMKRLGGTTEMRFNARTLACIDTASVAIRHLGLLDFDHNRFMDYMVGQIMKEVQEAQVYDPVTAFSGVIARHLDEMLVVDNRSRPNMENMVIQRPGRSMAMRHEHATKMLYIDTKELRKWLGEEKLVMKSMAAYLEQQGILLTRHQQIVLGAGTPYKASGRVMAWAIDLAHPAMSGFAREVATQVRAGLRENGFVVPDEQPQGAS